LAHAGGGTRAAAPQHLPRPGRDHGRLRVRGRLFTRVQKGLRYGTGNVATFQESDRVDDQGFQGQAVPFTNPTRLRMAKIFELTFPQEVTPLSSSVLRILRGRSRMSV